MRTNLLPIGCWRARSKGDAVWRDRAHGFDGRSRRQRRPAAWKIGNVARRRACPCGRRPGDLGPAPGPGVRSRLPGLGVGLTAGPGRGRDPDLQGVRARLRATPLEDELAGLGVSHIVLVGVATNWCVRATAYAALERGYDLTLVADAHTTGGDAAPHVVEDLNTVMRWVAYARRQQHHGDRGRARLRRVGLVVELLDGRRHRHRVQEPVDPDLHEEPVAARLLELGVEGELGCRRRWPRARRRDGRGRTSRSRASKPVTWAVAAEIAAEGAPPSVAVVDGELHPPVGPGLDAGRRRRPATTPSSPTARRPAPPASQVPGTISVRPSTTWRPPGRYAGRELGDHPVGARPGEVDPGGPGAVVGRAPGAGGGSPAGRCARRTGAAAWSAPRCSRAPAARRVEDPERQVARLPRCAGESDVGQRVAAGAGRVPSPTDGLAAGPRGCARRPAPAGESTIRSGVVVAARRRCSPPRPAPERQGDVRPPVEPVRWSAGHGVDDRKRNAASSTRCTPPCSGFARPGTTVSTETTTDMQQQHHLHRLQAERERAVEPDRGDRDGRDGQADRRHRRPVARG